MAVLGLAIDIYSLVVLAAVVLSWIRLSEDHPMVRITSALTEPLLGPIRRVLPAFGGFDFSAMVLLFGLRMVRGALVY
jgi:YggT family protein